MIKKAWSTDNCPLKVGFVVRDCIMKEDIMVTARTFDYSDEEDAEFNRNRNLIELHDIWFSGNDLLNCGARYVYYPNWPDTSVTKPCYFEEEEKAEAECLSNQEFFNEVFKLLRQMDITKGLYEPSDLAPDTYAWDNKAHAIIQDHLSNMLEELEALND